MRVNINIAIIIGRKVCIFEGLARYDIYMRKDLHFSIFSSEMKK